MVLGLFSKERALKRAVNKATNKLAQSPDRWGAMEKLLEYGTDDALYALCRRFSFTSSKEIEDLQEKEWVVTSLSDKGAAALPALRRYLKSARQVSYPLRILGNVAAAAEILDILDEVLAGEQPGYTRDPGKRIDIIRWLAEYEGASDEQAVDRILPYLQDFDENSRYAAVEALALRPTEAAAKLLVEALLNPEEESQRLKIRIGEVLADAQLSLCGRKEEIGELTKSLLVDFRLQRNKLARKKT